MTRRSELFRELPPPPGGLALLRERLEHRRRKRAWFLGVPAVASACGALVLLLRPAAPDPVRARLLADPLVHSLGLRPAQSEAALAEGRTALARVASANPKVAVYWVDSSNPPPSSLPTAGGGAREVPSPSR